MRIIRLLINHERMPLHVSRITVAPKGGRKRGGEGGGVGGWYALIFSFAAIANRFPRKLHFRDPLYLYVDRTSACTKVQFYRDSESFYLRIYDCELLSANYD